MGGGSMGPELEERFGISEGDAAPGWSEAGQATVISSRQPGSKTLIVFDWDDTVLPTSWLERQRMNPSTAPRHVQAALRAFEPVVRESFEQALKLGTVILVTNAAPGWIEASAQEFLPNLAARLRGLGMPIHAKPFHANMNFKLDVFRREAKGYSRVLSLGDGPVERLALLRCSDADVRLSVKFREMPTMAQLGQQHELLQARLAEIMTSQQDLDLRFQLNTKSSSGKPGVSLTHVSRPGPGAVLNPGMASPLRATAGAGRASDWPAVDVRYSRGRSTSPGTARSTARQPDTARPSTDARNRAHSETSGLPRIDGKKKRPLGQTIPAPRFSNGAA
jgi:hypothetical protein